MSCAVFSVCHFLYTSVKNDIIFQQYIIKVLIVVFQEAKPARQDFGKHMFVPFGRLRTVALVSDG